MKRLLPVLLVVSSVLALSACGTTAHCRRPQEYQLAQDRAPLVGAEGQELPESASALRIPPPVENPVGFGAKTSDDKGNEAWSCLDIPPKLVLPEDKTKS